MKNKRRKISLFDSIWKDIPEDFDSLHWDELFPESDWEIDFWDGIDEKWMQMQRDWFDRLIGGYSFRSPENLKNGYEKIWDVITSVCEECTIYDGEETGENFADTLESLSCSKALWRIDWIKKNTYLALLTWSSSVYQFYHGELQNDSIEAFEKSTLYLYSCFSQTPKGQLSNPLRVYAYLQKAFNDQKHVLEHMIWHYRNIEKLKRTDHIQDNEFDKFLITFRDIDERYGVLDLETLKRECTSLMQMHMSPEVWETYQEDIMHSIGDLTKLAEENIHCRYMFPYMASHVFAAYYLLSPNNESEKQVNIARERSRTFMEVSRLFNRHTRHLYFRQKTEQIQAIYENPEVKNPLIAFMEDLICRCFSPIHIPEPWKNIMGGQVIRLIQVNWLAFYLENRRVHFDENRFTMKEMGIPFQMFFEAFFEDEDEDHDFDITWIWKQAGTRWSDQKYERLEEDTKELVENLCENDQIVLGEMMFRDIFWNGEWDSYRYLEEEQLYKKMTVWLDEHIQAEQIKQNRLKDQYLKEWKSHVVDLLLEEVVEQLEVVFKRLEEQVYLSTSEILQREIFYDIP